MGLERFHPAVSGWFLSQFEAPTEPQLRAWPAIAEGRHTLVAAPTGSGKTLAAFLWAIDGLVRQGLEGSLPDETQVVYVSPLKALSSDVQKNLQQPIEGIAAELARSGVTPVPLRVLVRTGDTPASERAAMVKRPPHIVVTTPESLYILLTSERGRAMLKTVRTVIVDEIHALVGNKRGSHLALSLERLQALAGRRLVRIGLSATQRPIEEVAKFLVGAGDGESAPACTIVDAGHVRAIDLAIEVPRSPLQAVMAGEVWQEIYDRLAELIRAHRTTLIFTNTRRLAERTTRHLSERIGAEHVAAHHGSLSRAARHDAEQRLKSGSLRALVATASLELGIDIGSVDLVCQIGTTRSISTWLQRAGRSGHSVGGAPKGRLFPLSRDELVECSAILDSVRRGELDRLSIPPAPLDILAQQIVAEVASDEWSEDALFALVRRAYPYRDLPRETFDRIVHMLAAGFATKRGRRAAYLHHDAVNGRLRGRRGARLTAITSGGAIPDNADYAVVLEPSGLVVGSLNEDFAIESLAGDVFQLGNASWKILKIEPGRVRVEDARGQPPNIPFWLGEAPSRTAELSEAVSRLRAEVDQRLGPPGAPGAEEAAAAWLTREAGVAPEAASQIATYLASVSAALGVMPTQKTIVLERFFDETGGMQLVLHAPFGSRINRAWGLALRKRFCRKFNFELQAAATEDAIVLSLGPAHSFALEEVFDYLSPRTVRDVLVQALLDAPMFGIRWRWNASRALAIPRWRGGRRVPPQIQRMESEDLLALVFPDQLACLQDKGGGEREIPDHPLVEQTLRDCLEEAMDLYGLESLLRAMAAGELRLVARDLREPSPLAHEILNARPYAFLDDAPLEERRTQAVMTRRWLAPEEAAGLGALDTEAIALVRAQAWPLVRSADELHDALMVLGFLTEDEGRLGVVPGSKGQSEVEAIVPARDRSHESLQLGWTSYLRDLMSERRAAIVQASGNAPALWIAAERRAEIEAALPGRRIEPEEAAPLRGSQGEAQAAPDRAAALVEILRARLDALGPVTAPALARNLGLAEPDVASALSALETEGFVFQGRYSPGAAETEWCARRLLARIHRQTLDRMRREIEPVSAADYMRFLVGWQGLAAERSAEGPQSLARILEQLEGFEAPAAAWEEEILPARLSDYEPGWLDALCHAGRVVWGRRTPPPASRQDDELLRTSPLAGKRDDEPLRTLPPAGRQDEEARPTPRAVKSTGRSLASRPVRTTPIALVGRATIEAWRSISRGVDAEEPAVSGAARTVLRRLDERGASFFDDLASGTGLLRPQLEDALGELVAQGLVSSDGFGGLRALLTPQDRRPSPRYGRTRRRSSPFGMESAGRWTRLGEPDRMHRSGDAIEKIARALLRRYGVVFRRLLDREGSLPPWRDLLMTYRRLEARGEIRGGRFIEGFSGEQFALAEAVAELRAVRRRAPDGSSLSISAADPLNLAGIVTPGARVPALASNRLLLRDGVPVAVRESGEVRFLIALDPAGEWEAKTALLRRRGGPPAQVRTPRTA